MEKEQRPSAAGTSDQKRCKQDFKLVLDTVLAEAISSGAAFIDVRAGNLHARVGGYPGRGHSMPTCCSAMRDALQPGDTVLTEPLKGQGVSLHIRYCLPR